MSKRSTVIVSNTNKPKAQKVLSALYSYPALDGKEAYASKAGLEFFGIKLKKGIRKYWASSGPFHDAELTALINSGFAYHINSGDKFDSVVKALSLTKIIEEE